MAFPARTGIYSLPQEIIHEICWGLAEYDRRFSQPSHRHLPALARTCRFLSEPALDILWHTLPSIWPLLLLLPEDLRELRPGTPRPQRRGVSPPIPRVEFTFLREPRANDFERWVMYASRVRNIDHYCARKLPRQNRVLAANVPGMLHAHCPKPALLQLRSLRLIQNEISTRSYEALPIAFYLSPWLETVMVALPTHFDPDYLESVVGSFAQLAPRTEALKLRRGVHDTESFPANFPERSLRGAELGQLSCLTSFETGKGIGVAYDALLGLGGLPRLKKLDIRPRTDPGDWSHLGRRDGFFAALTELKLDGKDGNPTCCISLLGAIAPTSLDSVALDLRWPDSSQAETLFAALCSALGGLPCPASFNTLTIALGTEGEDQDRNIYHSLCIQPLLALSGLQSLVVQGGCKVIVDDALLDAMSRAWPAIRTIEFAWPDDSVQSESLNSYAQLERISRYTPPAPGAPDAPRATLAGLVPLALRCAHLEELALAVDMRVAPSFEGRRCGGRPPVFLTPERESRLETFRTEGSMLGGSAAVASFLSLVFPHLDNFGYEPFDWWYDTEELFGEFRELRRRERRWALRREKRCKNPADP